MNVIIACGPVIIEDGKVLLVQHGDTSFWKFCGGKMKDEDESLLACARREAREEVGVEIELLREEPFITHTTKKSSTGNTDVILVHFLAKRIGRIKLGADIQEAEWLGATRLKNEQLAPNIIPVLTHFGFFDNDRKD